MKRPKDWPVPPENNDANDIKNKFKILEITPELIIEILKPLQSGHTSGFIKTIKDGLPPDVELIDACTRSHVDVVTIYSNSILLKLKSEEFKGIPKGLRLPFVASPVIQYTEISEPAEIIEGLLLAITRIVNSNRDGNIVINETPSLDVIDNFVNELDRAQEYLETIKQSGGK